MAIFQNKISTSFQVSKLDNFYSGQIGRDFIDSYFVFNMAGNVSQIWLSAAHLPKGFCVI